MLPDYLDAVLFTQAISGRLLVVTGGEKPFFYLVGCLPVVFRPDGKTVITANCLAGSKIFGYSWASNFLSTNFVRTLSLFFKYCTALKF